MLLIGICVLLSVLLCISLVGIYNQKKDLKRFSGIVDVESEKQKIQDEISDLESDRDKMVCEIQSEIELENKSLADRKSEVDREKSDLLEKISLLKNEFMKLDDEHNLHTHGLYEPKYDFGESAEYKVRITDVRAAQKEMIRSKEAAICNTEWTIGNSRAEGKKMTDRQIKLMLRAFNGECDSIIGKVKYNNIASIDNRIQSAFDAINKLGEPHNCMITAGYLNSKTDELYLVHEYQEKLQYEKEEQRLIKEQIREEEKARREIEKAEKEAEKEEQQYQQALEKARAQAEKEALSDKERQKLQSEIDNLNTLLSEAQANKERAISRAQTTRSGHVYVVSNIGSFGENIYKVGMTRRIEPMDRVKELSMASVPFAFDVHAMIYSDDAPALENHLHGMLEKCAVNRVNRRKEFFNVSLEDIQKMVMDFDVEANFTFTAAAEEYRKTQAILNKEQLSV